MRIFNKKKIDSINRKSNEKIYINNISSSEKFLIKEIEKSKQEAIKNSIPLNYVKVDEKVITKVYKIPVDRRILKGNAFYFKDNNNINKKNYISNTANNEQMKKRKIFVFKPFSSEKMENKYYNQKINSNCFPRELRQNNSLDSRKYRPTDIQYSYKSSTKMDSSENKELLNIKSKCRSQANSLEKQSSRNLQNKNNIFYCFLL